MSPQKNKIPALKRFQFVVTQSTASKLEAIAVFKNLRTTSGIPNLTQAFISLIDEAHKKIT